MNETVVVKVRCNHAASRSVPFPETWRTALRCDRLSSIAEASVQKACEEFGFSDLECRILGKPHEQPLPRPNAKYAPGSTVMLQTDNGGRLDFLLCAHVHGDVWLCHLGTFKDNAFDRDNPFDAKDLVLKDVLRDAWEPDGPSSKRGKVHLNTAELRKAARTHRTPWEQVVATATFQAEEIRAAQQHRELDEKVAFSAYEKNHWNWKVFEGRASQVEIEGLGFRV